MMALQTCVRTVRTYVFAVTSRVSRVHLQVSSSGGAFYVCWFGASSNFKCRYNVPYIFYIIYIYDIAYTYIYIYRGELLFFIILAIIYIYR